MERKDWPLGNITLKFEPPDLFHCHVLRPVQIADAEETLRIMREEVLPGVGNFYFLVHTGELGTEAMPMETRKYFAAVKPLWNATVMIGGSKIARLAANVFMHAVIAMSPNKAPMKVVKNDEEAMAFIKEVRAKRARSA